MHAAARVLSLAGPDDVLASSTTRDSLEGSGIALEDAGSHELKGVIRCATGLQARRAIPRLGGRSATPHPGCQHDDGDEDRQPGHDQPGRTDTSFLTLGATGPARRPMCRARRCGCRDDRQRVDGDRRWTLPVAAASPLAVRPALPAGSWRGSASRSRWVADVSGARFRRRCHRRGGLRDRVGSTRMAVPDHPFGCVPPGGEEALQLGRRQLRVRRHVVAVRCSGGRTAVRRPGRW